MTHDAINQLPFGHIRTEFRETQLSKLRVGLHQEIRQTVKNLLLLLAVTFTLTGAMFTRAQAQELYYYVVNPDDYITAVLSCPRGTTESNAQITANNPRGTERLALRECAGKTNNLTEGVDYGQLLEVSINRCPHDTAPANGTLLQISSNSVLYQLIGTTYGGDGRNTFALPAIPSNAQGNIWCIVTWGY